MPVSPLQDLRKGLPASWVDSNSPHHRRPTFSHIAGPWCVSAPSVACSSPSPPQPQSPRTPRKRNNGNVMALQAKGASTNFDLRKPVLIVDPPLFPMEESEDLRNCRQTPAQVLTVNAHVKQIESKIPSCPPTTPSPQRLPTPDLPELDCDIFCDCCANQTTVQSTKEIMVSREKTKRKREIVYLSMIYARSPMGEA
jgi:hypothetical protein